LGIASDAELNNEEISSLTGGQSYPLRFPNRHHSFAILRQNGVRKERLLIGAIASWLHPGSKYEFNLAALQREHTLAKPPKTRAMDALCVAVLQARPRRRRRVPLVAA